METCCCYAKAMQLQRHFVEKPWGRVDVPAHFGAPLGQRIGEIWFEAPDGSELPILVKWLFTTEKLSIQVHPDDAQARKRGQISGKEECWVIISAEPGAVIGLGTIHPLSPDELRDASLSGEIEKLLDWKPVSAGDYFYIPAGTVHAIGAGIALVEVQQYADITYRLYDYGRPRELHLDDGVAVSWPEPYADPRSGKVQGNMQLVDGPHFRLWHSDGEVELSLDPRRWIVPLEGESVGQCLLLDPGEPVPFGGKMLIATL
jgi:mannose-6-phosphate isomerase